MELEDLLTIGVIVTGLAFLVMVVLTSLDLLDLYRQGAPPSLYARKVCEPVGFLTRQPANLLGSLGLDPDNELRKTLNALADRATNFCQEKAARFFAERLNPHQARESRQEAI